jgi:hypothetical protein
MTCELERGEVGGRAVRPVVVAGEPVIFEQVLSFPVEAVDDA